MVFIDFKVIDLLPFGGLDAGLMAPQSVLNVINSTKVQFSTLARLLAKIIVVAVLFCFAFHNVFLFRNIFFAET